MLVKFMIKQIYFNNHQVIADRKENLLTMKSPSKYATNQLLNKKLSNKSSLSDNNKYTQLSIFND